MEQTTTRSIRDAEGNIWEAFAADAVVAHGKQGAILAFRASASPQNDFLRSTVLFNSMAAADLALRTMSEKELRRRLSMARTAAGAA